MATIQRGILSGFSGAIGSVTGAKSKGINTMRARVTKPKNPKSAKQIQARQEFALTRNFFKEIHGLELIPEGFLGLNDPSTLEKYRNGFLSLLYLKTGAYIYNQVVVPNRKTDKCLITDWSFPDFFAYNFSYLCDPINPAASVDDKLFGLAIEVQSGIAYIYESHEQGKRFTDVQYTYIEYDRRKLFPDWVYCFFWVSSDFNNIYSSVVAKVSTPPEE